MSAVLYAQQALPLPPRDNVVYRPRHPSANIKNMRVFADSIVASFNRYNADFLADNFDKTAFFKKAAIDTSLIETKKKKAKAKESNANYKTDLDERINLDFTVASLSEIKGRTRLLKIRKFDGDSSILVAVHSPTLSMAFYEFQVGRLPNGALAIKDFYIYAMGTYFSDLEHNVLTEEGYRIATPDGGYKEPYNTWALGEAEKAFAEGSAKKAYRIVEKMRPKKGSYIEKLCIFNKARYIETIDNKKYFELLDLYHYKFPNDPVWNFLGMNFYAVKHDFKQAKLCAMQFDQSILGTDSEIKWAVGLMAFANKECELALTYFKQAEALDPTEPKYREYQDKVIKHLKNLETIFNYKNDASKEEEK